MIENLREKDDELRAHLKTFSERDNDFWSFRNKAAREYRHACFQYPAMMVPQMQRELISAVLKVNPNTGSLYEPFVGSGTVMTEAMMLGLNFVGQDINPLAVLLCRTKSGPFFVEALKVKIKDLIARIHNDRKSQIEVSFPGRDKWFRHDVAIALSKIRRAVGRENTLWGRRFFWVALAETVRCTSNSRTTTFKLHIRPENEIVNRELDPVEKFSNILDKNLESLSTQKKLLEEQNLLIRGRYRNEVKIELKSSTLDLQPDRSMLKDLLVTSPPYGDNKTTVPYGQHAYLPLQWIDLQDIDESLDDSCLASTYEIDKQSLGGRLAKSIKEATELLDLSPSFRRTIEQLQDEPVDRKLRVAAFCRDLNLSIEPILSALKANAYMIWTIGNRSVAGRPVPMDEILAELLIAKGAQRIESFRRIIPTKRMALKNSITATMNMETVLLLRKGG